MSTVIPYKTDIKIGDIDYQGYTIDCIHSSNYEFQIYEVKEVVALKVVLNYETCNHRYDNIMDQIQPVYLIGADEKKFNPYIAMAINKCLAGNPDEGLKIIENLLTHVIGRKQQKIKIQYMMACLFTCIFIIGVGVLYQNSLMLAAVFGSIGAVLSVAIGLPKLEIKYDDLYQTIRLTGVTRIIIASIAAIISYFVVNADVAFGFAKDNDYGLRLLLILSGFSETLIPNLLRKLENDNANMS